MPASMQKETGNVYTIIATGLLKKSDVDQMQKFAAGEIEKAGSIKLLITLIDFKGWEKGADWGDLDFFAAYDKRIDKIAVIVDPKWKENVLVFLGAGFRHAKVEYFFAPDAARAREWVFL